MQEGKTFGGLFFTQDSQHSSENLILLSCSCLLTRTNLILKQHAEPTGGKTFCNGSSLPVGTRQSSLTRSAPSATAAAGPRAHQQGRELGTCGLGTKWFVAIVKEQKAPTPLLLPRIWMLLMPACESSVVSCLVVTVW